MTPMLFRSLSGHDAMTPAALAERIAFTFTDGLRGSMSREEMPAHVIGHGSYHRGAVGGILAKVSIAAPRGGLMRRGRRCC